MTEEPVTVLKIIKAEDAPLGVPLWPADYEALLPHHTLERVEVVQSCARWSATAVRSSAGCSCRAPRARSGSARRSSSKCQ
jgi:hypothetical protein